MIDLRDIELLAIVQTDTTVKRTATTEGGNYSGACPVCGDKDDFYCVPNHMDSCQVRRGQAACRECHPKRMDAIGYLEWARKMSYKEAVEFLHDQHSLELPANWNSGGRQLQPAQKKDARIWTVKQLPMNAAAPGEKWQARARQAIDRAVELLWHETVGKEARAYLHGRGLTDDTIRAERLGFIAADTWDKPENWGLKPEDVNEKGVYLPRGIVFPYEYKTEIWKIRIRRIDADTPKEYRYMMLSGSSNGLYRADRVTPDKPTAIFEGEIDALSAAQDTLNEVACVATGSNSHARIPKWVMLLARAERVIRCFDPDAAGTDAHKYWQARLKESRAASVPGYHDANDMLVAGGDLASWLIETIWYETVPAPMTPAMTPNDTNVTPDANEPVSIPALPEDDTNVTPAMTPNDTSLELDARIAAFTSRPCASCGSFDYAFREDGRLICPCYFEKVAGAKKPVPTAPPAPYTPSTYMPALCCPFENVVEEKGLLKTKLCSGKRLSNGWCLDHQLQRQLLDQAALIQYPRMNANNSWVIFAGKVSWERFAQRAPEKRIKAVLVKIQGLAENVRLEKSA